MRTLLLYALPVLGANVLQSINGSVNAIWVGHFVGQVGLAATSNANMIMFLIFSMIYGFGMAVTILIGQHMGRGEIAGARRAMGSGLALFLLIGIAITGLGWVFAPQVLHLMATPADVYPDALAYLRVMFISLVPGLLNIYLGMTLRGAGDSMTPLITMIPAIIVEVSFNPIFILGLGPAPAMGIAGSAFASICANVVSVIGLVFAIYRRDLPIRLRGSEWRYLLPAPDLARIILVKGVPLGLQMIVVTGSALVMIGLVNHHGTATVAAYGAANQLWTYIQMPAFAIGMAVSGMAAQNIGAGLWPRVERIAWAGMAINVAMTGTLILLTIFFSDPLLRMFLPRNDQAVAIAEHINLLVSWTFVIQGLTMITSSIVRANGAGVVPLVILVIAYIPGRLGAALLLAPVLHADSLWWAFAIGGFLSAALNWLYYRHGNWRKVRLTTLETMEAGGAA